MHSRGIESSHTEIIFDTLALISLLWGHWYHNTASKCLAPFRHSFPTQCALIPVVHGCLTGTQKCIVQHQHDLACCGVVWGADLMVGRAERQLPGEEGG